jgi:hypothetical protein
LVARAFLKTINAWSVSTGILGDDEDDRYFFGRGESAASRYVSELDCRRRAMEARLA